MPIFPSPLSYMQNATQEQAGATRFANSVEAAAGTATDLAISPATMASAAGGNVVGPASSTDDALAVFDGATGKLLKNSNAILTETGALTTAEDITATTGDITATAGSINISTAGQGINIATGADARMGTSAAMAAGTVTVSTTAVAADSVIFLTANTPGGTQGELSAPTGSIVAGTSFVINSSSNTDTSTVNWLIINPTA